MGYIHETFNTPMKALRRENEKLRAEIKKLKATPRTKKKDGNKN